MLCLSQTHDFNDPTRWSHFTVESGLPSNDVLDIIESDDSTLWVTTPLLSYFDGFQWKVIDSSYGLPYLDFVAINSTYNNDIIVNPALHKQNNKMYFGNKSGFHEIKTNLEFPYAVGMDSTTFLIQSKNSLYLYSEGLLKTYLPHHELTEGKTLSIWKTSSRTVWLNLKSGLYRKDGQTWKLMISTKEIPMSLLQISEKRNGSGIVQFETPNEKRGLWEWTSSSVPKRNPSERATATISLDIGPQEEAIAVYRSGDIRWREKGVWQSLALQESFKRDINVVKFRTNGDLLFGSKQGFSLFRRSPSIWEFHSHPPPDPRNHISEIIKARDGSFWMASSGGLEHRTIDGSYHLIDNINNEIIQDVTALAEDSDGNIWIGSGSTFTGTYRFDGKDWKHFQLGNDSESVFIHKIRKDRSGRLWFLTIGKFFPAGQDPGAFEYKYGKFIRWGVQEGLIDGRVYDFIEGLHGSFWFATRGGISRWEPSKPQKERASISDNSNTTAYDGTWKHWTVSNGLLELRVSSIAIDQDNKVWFGSNYPPGLANMSGIGCIDTLGYIQYFGFKDGLIGENIWDIKVDSSGRLWVTTTNGLGCYDHGIWLNYGKRTGLLFVNLWPVLPIRNKIYVGTKGHGVAILDLGKTKFHDPRLTIDKPLVEGSSVRLAWKALTYWGEVEEREVKTRYRINNDNWSVWNTLHEIRLDNLKSGEYHLQVQAAGLYGQFNSNGEYVKFVIPPPFYLRPVFYFPVGSLFVTIVGLFLMLHRSRIRRRREIAVSEAKFRAVATTTASAILVFHEEGFMFANHSAEIMTGYEQDELMKITFWDIIHPEGLSEIKIFLKEVLNNTSVSQRFECRILTKMSEIKWIDITAAKISFMNIPAVIVSAFDITEKKNAELELVESEERFRLVVESAPNAMVMANRYGLIVLVNSKVEEYFGYTREELIGGSVELLIPQRFHEKHQTHQAMYQVAPRVRPMTERELLAKRKDGTEFPVEIGLNPVAMKDGNMVLCSIVDITRRKQDEEQKKSLAAELVQTEERERRRMAVYLHDIIGYHLTEGKFRLREIMRADISSEFKMVLKELGLNLDNAIEDSRALTFELSPPVLQDVRFDIAVKILAEQLMTKHNINLLVEYDKLEKLLEPEMKVLLYYAVRELLFNIIKHASAKEVKLTMLRIGTKFKIMIEDNGIGFDVNEVLSRNSATSGFGLKNVYERMGQIGVEFEIVSEHMKGTRVTIAVPMKTIS